MTQITSLLRVLVVDDSSDDTELLIRQLRRDGYDLSAERTETMDGLKAALDAQDWDIVVCDYNMPTFSGLDALAVVQERRPDLPFIFVSGVMGEDVAVVAMKAGAQDYITKNSLKRLGPAIARELRDAILRRQHARAETRRSAMEARYRQILSLAPERQSPWTRACASPCSTRRPSSFSASRAMMRRPEGGSPASGRPGSRRAQTACSSSSAPR